MKYRISAKQAGIIVAVLFVTTLFTLPFHTPKKSVTATISLQDQAELIPPSSNSNKLIAIKPANKTVLKSQQMVHLIYPEWQFPDNLAEHLQALLERVASGDNQARYILSRNLWYCYHVPKDEQQLQDKLNSISEFSDASLATSSLLRKYDYCKGITQGLTKQFYTYLKTAGEQGYVPAQLAMHRLRPEFYMVSQGFADLPRDEFITKRDNFKRQQVNFLENASQHGSLQAMSELAHLYASQNYGADGYIKAYALRLAILALTQDNAFYTRNNWLLQRAYDQLSPAEFEQATELSNELIQQVRYNGTLYPVD